MMRALLLLGLMALAAANTGCNPAQERAELAAAATAEAPGFATCAVCDMVVAEQPAPRAQLVLRDGSHKHLCSIGDLRAYLAAPGPAGAPVALFVEGQDPARLDAPTRDFGSWLPVQDAHFVVGFARPQVMGRPAYAFSRAEDAAAVATQVAGYAVRWSDLEKTPFNQDPPQPRGLAQPPPPESP